MTKHPIHTPAPPLSSAHLWSLAPGKPATGPKRVATRRQTVEMSDDDVELKSGGPQVLAARARERARCEAIMVAATASNLQLAANLAFKTRAGRAEAMAVLLACAS